jgi:hypothetical protein
MKITHKTHRLSLFIDRLHGPNTESHCSLFAVAYWRGVYIARGWQPLDGPRHAQHIANRGDLCVISYRSPDPKQPGHVVVVRPWEMTLRELDALGPRIAQAGETNYNSTIAQVGFRDHTGAWPNNVRYYWHLLA